MFYLAQTVPPFPVAEIRYPDNSGTKNLIDPSQLGLSANANTDAKTITLLTMEEFELKRNAGRNFWISPKRLVYDIETPFNSPMSLPSGIIAKGTLYSFIDAETGTFFGGGYYFNPEDVIASAFPPFPRPTQQKSLPVPEPSVFLGIASVGLLLFCKRNKRN